MYRAKDINRDQSYFYLAPLKSNLIILDFHWEKLTNQKQDQ